MCQSVAPENVCAVLVEFDNIHTKQDKPLLPFATKAKSVGGGVIRRRIMKIQLTHTFRDIVSMENLLEAWKEFVVGKKRRKDVQEFERNLMQNIIALHHELATRTYYHLPYEAFNISAPKPRNIHKASVRD